MMYSDIGVYLRFAYGFGRYLGTKIALSQTRSIIQKRLALRQENFLNIVKKGVFEYKKSPYLPLFQLARIDSRDFEKIVLKEGVEGALKTLNEEGVYFSVPEFKGQQPTIRRGKEFFFKERDFDNPYTLACYQRQSGATRSAGTRIMVDFDYLTDEAVHKGFLTDIWGLKDLPHIILRPAVTYGIGMLFLLSTAKFGVHPERWFSFFDDKSLPVSLRTRLGVGYMLNVSRFYGVRFPKPEFVDMKNIFWVVEFIHGLAQKSGGCSISSNVSQAVRLCLAAREKGIDLSGVFFQGCGEPLTATKKKEIEAAGAKMIMHYGFSEIGACGSLCKNAQEPDDLHFFKDACAMILSEKNVMDTTINAFLMTSLFPSSPKILINVESGDYGCLETRSCGCPYEELGLTDHIYNIRSFEKLTGEGMTFYGSAAQRIIEDILPNRFGGNVLDYQFVEEEDEKAITRLVVYIDPKVGPVDEAALARTILDELKKKNDSNRLMAQVWQKSQTISVRRQKPMATKAGKVFPLHILKGGER